MKAMGFDPGKRAAWLAMERAKVGAGLVLGCGMLDRIGPLGEDQRVAEAVDFMIRFEPEVVGVETVTDVYAREGFGPHMAGHLLRAARLGGRIFQAATDHGFHAVEITAERWRKWLVNSRQARNPKIRQAMRVRFKNWPGGNEHEADAGGVALMAAEDLFLARLGVRRR